MKISSRLLLATSLLCTICFSCNRNTDRQGAKEARTSGTTTILVDETYGNVLDRQIEVFQSDYPETNVQTIVGNENKIISQFTSGKVKMIALSRRLKPAEENFYKRRKSAIYVDRFAIDGLALITNKASADSTITVEEALAIMKGESTTGLKLVFDNAYSSTLRYFIDTANITALPKVGVYTLETTNDVIKYVSENKGYVGVVGYSWLLRQEDSKQANLAGVKVLGVANKTGVYKPTQANLINGKYPFLRNIYILNAEGTNGLGTGFANWLSSPRGQLIVLKSGLGPHKEAPREFNFKTNNKK